MTLKGKLDVGNLISLVVVVLKLIRIRMEQGHHRACGGAVYAKGSARGAAVACDEDRDSDTSIRYTGLQNIQLS